MAALGARCFALLLAAPLVIASGCDHARRNGEEGPLWRDRVEQALEERLARDSLAARDPVAFRSGVQRMTGIIDTPLTLEPHEARAIDATVTYVGAARSHLLLSGTGGRYGALASLEALHRVKPGLVLVRLEINASTWSAEFVIRPRADHGLLHPESRDVSGEMEMQPFDDRSALCLAPCKEQRANIARLQREVRALESLLGADAIREVQLQEQLAERDRLLHILPLARENFGAASPIFESGEIVPQRFSEPLISGRYPPAARTTPTPGRDPFVRHL